MMLTAYGLTETGRVRASNEDAVFWDADLGLFVVADGMGGHNAGEVASQLTVETLRDCVVTPAPDAGASRAERLAMAIRLANTQVFETGHAVPECSGMGTTVAAALIEGDVMTYAGVGDSRIYSWLGGTLTQLTVDDTWVQRMRDEHPDMTEAMIAANPLRHVLTNVIGAHAETLVTIAERTLSDGELILLCSDGFYGPLEGPGVGALLPSSPDGLDLPALANTLVAAALDAGSRDNVTVLLVQYRAG